METLKVTCPDCGVILIVDRKTGEVLETRRPIIENSTGNRFEDARQKVMQSKTRAEQLFEEAKRKEKEKMSRLESLFQEKKAELKDKPIERPDRPIDRD